MATKLSIGFQKKIGMPDYGSAGAHCQVEFEIDLTLLQDPDAFQEKARHAFAACQHSVNDQLARQGPTRAAASNGDANGHANGHATNGTTNGSNGHASKSAARPTRPATQSQARAIRAIASKQRLDLERLLEQRFGVGRPENLRLSEASSLIDELKNNDDVRGDCD